MKAYFEGDKDVLVFKPIPASKIGRPKKNVPVTNVVKSNADHIRSMTDEELAEYLWVETDKTFNYCDVCKHYRLTAPHCAVRSQGSECIKARVDWLKQPYKEDA